MRPLLLAAAAVAAVSLATPASAACYGVTEGRVCSTVSPTGGTLYSTCLYLGGGCIPVVVPGPDGCVSAGGQTWTTIPICV